MSTEFRKSFFIWMLAPLFYCYQYVIRVSPNLMTDELMSAFSIDASVLGTLIGMYYYSYSLMQIPLGITIDHVGPKRILAAAALLCGVSCLLFTWAPNIYWAGAARFLIGLGSGCAYIGTIKLATMYFDLKRLGTFIGITMLLGTSGATLGGEPMRHLINLTTWQMAINILGFVGIALGVLIYLFMSDKKLQIEETVIEEEVKLLHGLKKVLASPKAWAIAIFATFMYLPIGLIGDLWGVSFIQEYYKISKESAATVISLMFIGVAIGAPLFTVFSDFIETRKKIMMYCALGCTLVYCVILFVAGIELWLMYCLFFFAGLFFGGQCLAFASVCEIMPNKVSGVALGFTNSIVMTSGAFGHPLTGWLTEMYWDGTMAGGAPVYSIENYKFALTIIPISLALAFLITLRIEDTYPSKYKKEKA